MKTYDMHSDIGTNLYEHDILNNEDNSFDKYHLNDLKAGEVDCVFAASFFSGVEDWTTMQKMVENCQRELNNNKNIQRVLNKDDLDVNKLKVLMSVEGMCGIRDDVSSKIRYLYDKGVRVASLVWNESNELAEGWPNDPLRGLSDKGKEAIRTMNDLRMIIDVSHANEKTFWDIISYSKRPVIATHSNARNVCHHDRNLTDQQLKAIASKGGVVGLNAAKFFVSDNEDEQTALGLAKQAFYIANLIGVDHVGCGFDYMNFLGNYPDDDMAEGLEDASKTQNLIKALYEVGFSDEEVEKIAYLNVYNFLRNNV